MALDAYLQLVGETAGTIAGDVELAGREGSIRVIASSHEIVAPRDAASGLATGRRQHRPLTVTKPIDRASPLLASVLCNNENITEWRLDYFRPSRSGREELYFTVELVNASIVSIHQEMLNNKYPENMKHEVREHVGFVYQKIIWTWHDGGITTEDDWHIGRG